MSQQHDTVFEGFLKKLKMYSSDNIPSLIVKDRQEFIFRRREQLGWGGTSDDQFTGSSPLIDTGVGDVLRVPDQQFIRRELGTVQRVKGCIRTEIGQLGEWALH